MTVPLVIAVGLLLSRPGSGGTSDHPTAGTPLPTVTVAAPEETDAATVSTCARVISALPLTLAGQGLRLTASTPASPSIVAWGDPPIVLRCGVARPKALTPALGDQLIQVNHTVSLLPERHTTATTFTVIDRAVYIDVTVPSSYAQPPLGPIVDAIAAVLPHPVCSVDAATPDPHTLCTRRP